jgi:hypothetical protein
MLHNSFDTLVLELVDLFLFKCFCFPLVAKSVFISGTSHFCDPYCKMYSLASSCCNKFSNPSLDLVGFKMHIW